PPGTHQAQDALLDRSQGGGGGRQVLHVGEALGQPPMAGRHEGLEGRPLDPSQPLGVDPGRVAEQAAQPFEVSLDEQRHVAAYGVHAPRASWARRYAFGSWESAAGGSELQKGPRSRRIWLV